MSAIRIETVKTLRQVLDLRKIRNECRLYMTRNQDNIGVVQQIWWWLTRPPTLEVFLVYNGSTPVAYGLKNGYEISGGVTRQYRGIGTGRIIFTKLTYMVEKPGRLEVLKSNIRARKLYEDLGWEYVGDKDSRVLSMVYNG